MLSVLFRLFVVFPVVLLAACGLGSDPVDGDGNGGGSGGGNGGGVTLVNLPPELTGFLVKPYLQNPGPDHMTVMFEPETASIGDDMRVEYRVLGTETFAAVEATQESIAATNVDAGTDTELAVHAARLSGLSSNTTYEYRVITASGTTPVMRFKTWPAADDGVERGRFILISDIQGNHPYWLKRIFEEGVIGRDCGGDAYRCVEEFAGIIITGDLVNDGDNIDQWRDEYFAVGDSLFRYLPQLMIVGNHDYALSNYLYYAAPPSNGTLAHDEEWYQLDYLNFRFLGMQSNTTVAGALAKWTAQTEWFRQQMADARDETGLGYVFIGVHAPCKSELWLDGESTEVCAFVDRLEALAEDTGLLTGHLFGHTHGYSRGQSRDVPLLWMNVASASGSIDDFGDYGQYDYDEFETSWDEYGYSILEFTTQGTPEIRSVRRSGGDDAEDYADAFTAATDRDSFVVGGDNTAPAQPVALLPASDQVLTPDVMLHASYADADGDALHEAHWQVRRASGSYDRAVVDVWGNETRARNDWFRMNLNEGVNVDYWRVPYLAAGDYCWRVRYRDEKWAWSDFSDEACFTVADVDTSDNLLVNGDAESGTDGWSVDQGVFESLNTVTALGGLFAEGGLCGFGVPAQGLHWFVLGGCVELAAEDASGQYTVVSQTVDVSAYATAIGNGQAVGLLQLQLRDSQTYDIPGARFRALNAAGEILATAKPVIHRSVLWTAYETSLLLPPETVAVKVELTGVRQEGVQSDAFIDDVSFSILSSETARDFYDASQPVLSPGNGMAIKPKEGAEI